MNDNDNYKFLTQKQLREIQDDIAHAVTIYYASLELRTDDEFLNRDKKKDPDIKLLMKRYLEIEDMLTEKYYDENGNWKGN